MSGGFTDKSLLVEGREWGWFSPQRRPFAEPGIRPHYGPSLEFVVNHLSLRLRISPKEGSLDGEALVHIGPTPTGLGTVRLDLSEVDVSSVTLEVSSVEQLRENLEVTQHMINADVIRDLTDLFKL